jgi:20S proteasome alpha/beta subunit
MIPFGLLVLVALLASVSSSSSSSTYESVRALDRSGQALQLKHAQAASDKQGRLLLAFVVDNKNVYIVSPETRNHSYQSSQGWMTDRITAQGGTYICCSGVQGDARWLLQRLREYGKAVQLRYDSNGIDVAEAAAAINRAIFWAYEDKEAWQNCLQTVLQGQDRWGRPVGVRTLVISKSECWQLQIVEPSGVIQTVDRGFACLGKQSEEVQTKLEQLLRDRTTAISEDDLLEVLREALSSIVTATHVNVEVISEAGVERKPAWSLV